MPVLFTWCDVKRIQSLNLGLASLSEEEPGWLLCFLGVTVMPGLRQLKVRPYEAEGEKLSPELEKKRKEDCGG